MREYTASAYGSFIDGLKTAPLNEPAFIQWRASDHQTQVPCGVVIPATDANKNLLQAAYPGDAALGENDKAIRTLASQEFFQSSKARIRHADRPYVRFITGDKYTNDTPLIYLSLESAKHFIEKGGLPNIDPGFLGTLHKNLGAFEAFRGTDPTVLHKRTNRNSNSASPPAGAGAKPPAPPAHFLDETTSAQSFLYDGETPGFKQHSVVAVSRNGNTDDERIPLAGVFLNYDQFRHVVAADDKLALPNAHRDRFFNDFRNEVIRQSNNSSYGHVVSVPVQQTGEVPRPDRKYVYLSIATAVRLIDSGVLPIGISEAISRRVARSLPSALIPWAGGAPTPPPAPPAGDTAGAAPPTDPAPTGGAPENFTVRLQDAIKISDATGGSFPESYANDKAFGVTYFRGRPRPSSFVPVTGVVINYQAYTEMFAKKGKSFKKEPIALRDFDSNLAGKNISSAVNPKFARNIEVQKGLLAGTKIVFVSTATFLRQVEEGLLEIEMSDAMKSHLKVSLEKLTQLHEEIKKQKTATASGANPSDNAAPAAPAAPVVKKAIVFPTFDAFKGSLFSAFKGVVQGDSDATADVDAVFAVKLTTNPSKVTDAKDAAALDSEEIPHITAEADAMSRLSALKTAYDRFANGKMHVIFADKKANKDILMSVEYKDPDAAVLDF